MQVVLLMVDNYDSFTYNLVQCFTELGEDVLVYRNDEITVEQVQLLSPDYIVIGPGPCSPKEAEGANRIIKMYAGKIPMLGVCLGHQCMAHVFGGEVIRAPEIMHGKTAMVSHNNQGMFEKVPNPIKVVRYHSLVISPQSLPSGFNMTAWTQDGDSAVVMGMLNRPLMMEGVQFHPESFMTDCGTQMLEKFLMEFRCSERESL